MRLGDLTAVFPCGALTYEADIDPEKWRYATAQIYDPQTFSIRLGTSQQRAELPTESSNLVPISAWMDDAYGTCRPVEKQTS